MKAITAILLLTSACVNEARPITKSASVYKIPTLEQLVARTTSRLDALELEKENALIWQTCESPIKPGKCGLVYESWDHYHAISKFVKDTCHENQMSDSCHERFLVKFKNVLRARYSRASEGEIDAACFISPEKCASDLLIEQQWLQSHDEHVVHCYDALENNELMIFKLDSKFSVTKPRWYTDKTFSGWIGQKVFEACK